MSEQIPTDDTGQLLALGLAATERGEYDAGLKLLERLYQLVPAEKMPKGLSSYGLCMAKAGGKNRAGSELCEKAIKLEFYEGRHHANLVRVYMAANNRRKAVDVLEKGLKKMRNDPALLRVRDEIGYRKTPYFAFLRRTNPVNLVYSKSASSMKARSKVILIILGVIVYVAAMAAVFFTILE